MNSNKEKNSKKDIENYINEYIDLCSKLLYKNPEDYENKLKIKEHNCIVKKILKLSDNIEGDNNVAQRVYKKLLENNNESVKLWSSDRCLKIDIFKSEAIEILNDLANKSKNKIIAFEAKLALTQMNTKRD